MVGPTVASSTFVFGTLENGWTLSWMTGCPPSKENSSSSTPLMPTSFGVHSWRRHMQSKSHPHTCTLTSSHMHAHTLTSSPFTLCTSTLAPHTLSTLTHSLTSSHMHLTLLCILTRYAVPHTLCTSHPHSHILTFHPMYLTYFEPHTLTHVPSLTL